MPSREDLIQNCGLKDGLFLGRNGLLSVRKLMCGYYKECPKCKKVEYNKRKKIVESIFHSPMDNIYRATISENEWKNIGSQMSKKNIDYIKNPLPNGEFLVYSTDIPYKHKDAGFVKSTQVQALEELTREEILFPQNGKIRSSSRNWSLTKTTKLDCETIEIETVIPCFEPTPEYGKLITRKDMESLFLHASTWKRGEITMDNAQEYSDYRMNKAISLALARGMSWDYTRTRLVTTKCNVDDLKNWKVALVNSPALKDDPNSPFWHNVEYLLQINEIDPEDHVRQFKEWLLQNHKGSYDDSLEILFGEG